MGSTKHEKSFVDYDSPYETNVIGLKGVLYFGIGLLLLIVVTFGLMAAFLNVLAENAEDEKRSDNPMMLGEKDRLPPEPRLQAAPGYGVESEGGRVNLELAIPQAEYRHLRRQWQDIWDNGQKHPGTETAITMPIEMAKEKLLGQAVKAKTGPEAANEEIKSRMYITDASSGRAAALRRR